MTKHLLSLLFLLLAVTACGGSENDPTDSPSPTPDGGETGIELPGALDPKDVSKSNAMHVFAHYMPWFETPETNNGKWGQHWTMSTCNPNQKDSNGRRQIASHYYPLIGPYASSDATVLNYHALLMKYSGLEGVMIDWYGTQNVYDYPANEKNTKALVQAIDRVGLKFAIVYEDATLAQCSGDKTAQAAADMAYIEKNYFKKENYVKTADGKPLLMIFGPQQLQKPEEWTKAFSGLSQKPTFVVLNGFSHCANNANHTNSAGEFLWVNGNPDYSKIGQFSFYIGGAMPGFLDYYKEGGQGNGYTTYDHENGALFDRQLAAAKEAKLDYLQISTWNDFGEGTNIEPTVEYGYRYLTRLQQFTGVSYQESNLKLIHRWYEQKVKHAGASGTVKEYLSQAFYFLIALQPDKAEVLVKAVEEEQF
ncbi:MAG: hypothetical protein IJ511_05670 [Bacteroides sp.]|nr:hypothetical protein [Bacteroides sp.]